IAWYHEFDGGRAFYTGGGHTDESFSEPLFLKHVLGGIKYAINDNSPLDYSKAYAVKKPEDNRFNKTVLSNDLNEPMELAISPDGRVFFIERAGNFYVYDPANGKTSLVRKFPVAAVDKYLNGLLGMTIDPDFGTNNFIYFFNTASKNDQTSQHISRFVISKDNVLDLKSEKVLLEIPIDLEVSAHTGGSLAWDKNKNLYISTGDNTVPFNSDGYAPIDRIPGRLTFNAERSSGNTNDLRGKILRIHPEPDGSYSVPEGNLFAKGTLKTRPEIYVMGCRNPYRISVDAETGILYWGEIGPDSGTDGLQGPRGYDEFNQAKKAGNYGWPYFVGNNKTYKEYDFQTKTVGNFFNVNAPVNSSYLNTGAEILPAPQKPMVWYPYNSSEEFPLLGLGGRCAMGGPVYNFDPNLKSTTKISEYYDKSLFVYDWMRNWVFAVKFDENHNYKRMEPFMETNGDFRRPIDFEVGPEGSFYMLEYGSVYGIDNVDARLVRIDFNSGNRTPIAKIQTNDTIGIVPYKVAFKSASMDFDEDQLSYEWRMEGNEVTSTEANPNYTFKKNGLHTVMLKVTDGAGKSSMDTVKIEVGNTLPKVVIQTNNNSSFFFANKSALQYNVAVNDDEDKVVDPKRLKVKLNFISKVGDTKTISGHQQITTSYNLGKSLIAKSDCKACHQLNAKSVGPSFTNVSKRYNGKSVVTLLSNKIIKGGGGVWGEHAMAAHPQISKQDAAEMVKYILSITAVKKPDGFLPQKGVAQLNNHTVNPDEGRYIFTASYTDKGGNYKPLTTTKTLVLRPAKVEAEDADLLNNVTIYGNNVGSIHNRSYMVFKDIDLKNISQLTYRYSSESQNATLEVHSGSLRGPLISTLNYEATGNWNTYIEKTTPISDPGGRNDLYFVWVKKTKPNRDIYSLDWIKFDK
ncbi:MAG: PQQ-dependent sugar dehydrogenase, partial [Flavobacterium sp.]|nr:PQQ-dependent sugar dehydrogenase [Pedobacter sp.]